MKNCFFFLFFFTFCFHPASASQNKTTSKLKGCNYEINQNYLKKIDSSPIRLIEVDTHDYRKWTVNSVRILTSRYRYVPEKFKRRFDATISITYGDNSKCSYHGRVRHSGDEKDHIGQLDNSITQSLDVHLTEGNIRGITKFKLLRPKTRGNLEDEIFITEILRNLNFLAPRTIKVDARVNKVTTPMLFQEKAAKEMLEFNGKREGPILEADERFFFKSVSKIEDNNLSGWSMGVVPLMNKSSKYMLSKQVNAKILEKSEGHSKMSFKAVANLNLIYLYFSNRFQDQLNNFNYFDYDLENTLLGSFNKKKINKLNEYNIFIQAINGTHGLAANNRKFYWNSIENYFEPINYDSNANIEKDLQDNVYRYPISENFNEAFQSIKLKLKKLNYTHIVKNLNLSGLNISNEYVENKILKIIKNIEKLQNNYINYTSDKLLKHNETKLIKNILYNFHKNLKEEHPKTYLVKQNSNMLESEIINNFQKCEIFLENCVDINLSLTELSSLLEGDLKKENIPLQYLGKNFDFSELTIHNNFNKYKYKNVSIFYEEGINIKFDKLNKIINIKQSISGAKIFFLDGQLENLKINFEGFNNPENSKLKEKPKDFPINQAGLTGCLSLINLNVKNIEIIASNSTCEDSINFINTTGNINKINIINSYSDGLDIDFSNLKIKKIDIKSAANDCVDLSYGVYEIDKLNLSNCGDKALSVGEKSKINLEEILVNSSQIGIASKDSSYVEFEYGYFNTIDTCLTAYKKKQEFEGGIIKAKNMKCDYIKKKISFDKYSIINIKNNI